MDLQIDADEILHFYNVHLGTALLERRDQAQRLASIVHDRRVAGPKIVLGDFNEWARRWPPTYWRKSFTASTCASI